MSDSSVPTLSAQRRPDLPPLTSLRAFAALLVFVYHLFLFGFAPFRGFAILYSGVSFFFVLSGFILTWSHVPAQSAGQFYLRRFARIYPSHFVIWFVLLFAPLGATAVTPMRAVTSVLLVQTWSPDGQVTYGMNGVSWSLGCEAFFYALFPFAMPLLHRLSLRGAWLVAGGAFVLASIFVLVASRAQGSLGTIGLSDPVVRLPEFLLGIVAARTCIEGHRPRWWQVVVVLVVAVAGLAAFDRKPAADVWATPISIVVIVAAATWGMTESGRWLRWRPLVYAGQVSFAFYLVHELVIVNAHRLIGTGPLAAAIAFVLSVAIAIVVHHSVEVPANRFIVRGRRRLNALKA